MRALIFIGLVALCVGLVPANASAQRARVPAEKAQEEPAGKGDADPDDVPVTLPTLEDNNGDMQLRGLKQQFIAQFRMNLNSEMHFIHKVCALSKDQRRQLEGLGNRILEEASTKYAEAQQAMMQGRFGGGGISEFPDPRKLIRTGLAKVVEQQLTAAQVARYQDEFEKRAANRKRVTVVNLVAKLDEELVLSAEQRDKLAEALAANWQDIWGQSLEGFMYGQQFLPNLPNEHILPVLNATQQRIWQSRQQNQNVFFMGGWAMPGMFGGMAIEEAAVEEAAVEEAQQGAPRRP